MPLITYAAKKFSAAVRAVAEEQEAKRLLGVVSSQWEALTEDL